MRLVAAINRFGLRHRRLERPGVYLEKQVAFFDELPFLEVGALQSALHPRAELHQRVGYHAAQAALDHRHIALFHIRHPHRGGIAAFVGTAIATSVEIPIAAQHKRQQSAADDQAADAGKMTWTGQRNRPVHVFHIRLKHSPTVP